MKCPVDQTELLMTERQGVEIDYCPKCRGVWLDRGELDKIIEKATPEVALPDPEPAPIPQQAPQTAPQPTAQAQGHPQWDDRDDSFKHAKRYKKKRRKSFLEEVFDVFD